MMRRRAAVRALAVAAAAVGATVAVVGPASAQVLPPVTTPPIDIGVPGLGIGVHVPGQEVGGSSGPSLPDVPGLPRTVSKVRGFPALPGSENLTRAAIPFAAQSAGYADTPEAVLWESVSFR